MKPFERLLTLLAIVLLAAACGQNSTSQPEDTLTLPQIEPVTLKDGERLNVVATTSIIGDVVANIGGDSIQLTMLIGLGQNPHSFEPTPHDLAAIEDADLIFVNGLDLEEVLVESIRNIAIGPIVPVSAGIQPIDLGGGDHEDEDHAHTSADPHFWIDPNNVIIWVENIQTVLSTADPANSGTYQANAQGYTAELQALDAYIREQVAAIPPTNRKLVTDHHLLGYFAQQYGFEVVGTVIPSFSDTAGASARDVATLVEIIQQEDVPALFIGATASQGLQKLADAISDELGSDFPVLPLLTGSLNPAGQPGDTYLSYIRYNTDQIITGLTN